VAALNKRVPGARGCDVSHPELLVEIWAWKPSCELRWTKENLKGRNHDLYRAGDTLATGDTHGPPITSRRTSAVGRARVYPAPRAATRTPTSCKNWYSISRTMPDYVTLALKIQTRPTPSDRSSASFRKLVDFVYRTGCVARSASSSAAGRATGDAVGGLLPPAGFNQRQSLPAAMRGQPMSRLNRPKSLVVKRAVPLAGRRTSVSLEDAFWQSLNEIARGRGMIRAELIATIDSEPQHGGLSCHSPLRARLLSAANACQEAPSYGQDRIRLSRGLTLSSGHVASAPPFLRQHVETANN
jgi:predicted DNA-binding ribbon-helix-helix protein